ncbi:bifunctional diguanylate cyclase/phosphodiesterase [Aureimonas jatrophae]|uniref:Diguanylate cyclase (GGDEF) domain-containing protein n=1 Tax=Aureimonas jatrophae TaxID=1166073 RepID=A0A1H0HUC9_9HYPH|nr:EAL domain-containing protein [Aureimonas jatrophae]MBB3950777.1 diguanylate cyclase (GGDEF)-like protein [Aureimonas jatrophae]SDO22670.1 diguanylate cyclase (GGDEF) domain-containing protein [Aureimonas jatrophae]
MTVILTCLGVLNDPTLLALAAFVCTLGVYGSFSVARHAGRCEGRARRQWAVLSLVTAGSTAWATHMVALLAFRPGMPSGFEPFTTALSLVLAICGIGLGLLLTLGRRERWRRFAGGVVIGLGVTVLHYVGQAAYVVRGHVVWDHGLVAATILLSLPLFGLATLASVERRRAVNLTGAPLLVLAIGLLHLGGMAALQLEFDPRVALPSWTVPPEHLAPVVAAVSFGLVLVAMTGLRLTLSARRKLRTERQRLGELANLALEGLAICEGDRIVSANDSLARLSGFPRETLATMTLRDLVPKLDLSALPEREEADADLTRAAAGPVPVRVLCSGVRLAGRPQTVIAFRDQSERLRGEARIRALAFSDALTGLANRARFHDALAGLVAAHKAGGAPFSLLVFDLDGFKGVNDAVGHTGGDDVLRIVAERIRALPGSGRLVARLGGDEFAVLVENDADPLRACAVGQEIIEAIERPITVGHHAAHISASVGVMTAQAQAVPAADLLTGADLALYDAKANGRGRVRLFTPELRRASAERRGVADDLETAWDERHFELYYQPQVRLCDGRIVGAEALIRWNFPYMGVLSPAAFLSVLEAGHLAVPVGDWILRTACADAVRLRAEGQADFRIGVNLFAAQLRLPDFVERVEAALAATGLPPEALELEITENIVLRNERTIASHLARLRAMGVGIAFDDFGTGFASLTMLKQLDITRLKIDRSFVRDIETDRKDQGIVDAVVRMAEGCGLDVIAEGIETAGQARYLAGRLTEGQGYLFGKPMPFEAFRTLCLAGAAGTAPQGDRRFAMAS